MTQHSETMMTIAMAGRKIDEFEAALHDRDRRIVALQADVAKQNKWLQEQADEVATLKDELNLQLMHVAGLEAQRDHMKAMGDQAHHAWAQSGRHFKDGVVKTRLRLVYEAAFDARGGELGVKDPSRKRKA